MIFRRSDAADITIIAVNVTDIDATVPSSDHSADRDQATGRREISPQPG
jgi:hypothetical protein